MKLPSVRLLGFTCAVGALSLGLACGSKSSPAAPTPTPTPVAAAPTIAAPVPSTPTAGQRVAATKPDLVISNAAVTGAAGTVTYEFELRNVPANSFTGRLDGQELAGGHRDQDAAAPPPGRRRAP